MALLWGIVGVVAPALVGIALALVAMPNATATELIAARVCLSITALVLSAATIIWELKTDSPFTGKLVLGCLMGLLVFVAFPISIQWVNGRSTKATPAGLKIVIALSGINEEKDRTASADGAAIALFNDGPSVLKDIHQILRFPTLKSAEVLDRYKSNASITGGGKPGSDYMVVEIPELPPTQRVMLQVAFAEKEKVTSVEAWASQYGYTKDNIQVQQGFMGKEQEIRTAEPKATSDLMQMNNEQLRDATIKFVNKLRQFNSDFRRTDDQMTVQEWSELSKIISKIPDQEKPETQNRITEIRNQVIGQHTARMGQFEDAYRANYLIDAQLFDRELRKRSNIKTLITDPGAGIIKKGHIWALDGKLAGPDPLLDLANYLESLAKQLPRTGN